MPRISYDNYDGSLDQTFGIGGIQISPVGTFTSSIQRLIVKDNTLYAVGYGQFPGTLGVVARYVFAPGGALPVSLLDFTAVLHNTSVLVAWMIASEKNLGTFVIERSSDGNRFIPINSVPVTGISSVTKQYSIMDDNLMQGVTFYRLKMIDFDGTFSYSNIVAVKVSADTKFKMYPNPAKKVLFVEATGNNENTIVQITDVSGRKVEEMKILLNTHTSFSMDISKLANGTYNLVLYKKGETEVQRFIKR